MLLRDTQWQELEPLLTGRPGDPGASGANNRLFIEAVLSVVLNDGPWTRMPRQFGKWSAAYMRFRRWNECGFWRRLAQSEIKDRELLSMLARITVYGDRYTERQALRLARKANKAAYKSALGTMAGSEPAGCLPSTDESILHWVGLVMS